MVDGGAPAPCVFQRLARVGNGLDGELAQLVPQAGLTSAQTNAVIPPRTPISSRSCPLKSEFRRHTTVHLIYTVPPHFGIANHHFIIVT